jgi:uncharacterized protein (TIRG00374 family)
MLKSTLKYFLSTALALGLLYWAFSTSNIQWQDIYDTLAVANYQWILISILISIFSHVLRAWRWEQLLGAMNFYPGTLRTFSAVMIGYFANFIVPRMGEVSRCGSLTKTAKIPFTQSFGTVITERIVDLLGLLFIVMIAFFIAWEPMQQYLFPNTTVPSTYLIVSTVLILGALAYAFIFFKNKIGLLWKSFATQNKIGKVLAGWIGGILSIKNVKNPQKFILYSVLIWICYYLNAYVLLMAFPISQSLSLSAGLMVLVMGTFGMATPTQGGIGAYHKLVSATLVFYLIPLKDATVLATFFHGTQMITILLLGGLSFILTLFLTQIDAHTLESK